MQSLKTALATALLVATTCLAGCPASAEGDPVRGKAVFRKCAACHAIEKDVNRLGPSLFDVIGRPVASVPDFSYSDALKAMGNEGKVWDEATLSAYLRAPRDTAPGTRMAFAGLRKPADVEDLMAYLKSLPASP